MPVYTGKYRTLLVDFTPYATIPLVYLYSLNTIYLQIIDEDLYNVLLASDITWVLLSTGDFLIERSDALDELDEEIRDYNGDPPLPECYGKSLIVTYISSSNCSHTSGIDTSTERFIETECFGSTNINSYVDTVKHSLSSGLTINLERFIE